MKSLSSKLAVTLLVAVLPLATMKAEPGTGGTGGGGPKKDAGERHKDRGAEMKQALGLTDEQAAKVGEILKSDGEAIKAIKNDSTLDDGARKAKLKELHKASEEKVNAVLTPEQVTKKEAFKKERMEKMREKKGTAAGGTAPTS